MIYVGQREHLFDLLMFIQTIEKRANDLINLNDETVEIQREILIPNLYAITTNKVEVPQ